MINLDNDLTLIFRQVTYDFFRGFVGLTFELFPTMGAIAGLNPDEYKVFDIQGMKNDIYSGTFYDLMIGKSKSEIKQVLLEQWQLYQTSPGDIEESLRALIEYVDTTGIKQD